MTDRGFRSRPRCRVWWGSGAKPGSLELWATFSNAIKYSTDNGEVIVSVACEIEQSSSWAVLRVKDHGIGIPADDLPHLFEPFHRAQNTGAIRGTGIGLAGCKQIVEAHRGTITVESIEGEGSTFTVRLPLPADGLIRLPEPPL